MRIYADCKELMSELLRDVNEMGIITHSNSMQNIDVTANPDYDTKEIINYHFCLTSLDKQEFLFLDDQQMAWCFSEIEERFQTNLNPGLNWQKRREVWEKFLNKEGRFDYAYPERINKLVVGPGAWESPLRKVINALNRNPDTRQAILSIWDRTDVMYLGGERRVPCSIYYQFLLREGMLHVIYNQRSADAVTHLGNDIWLAFMMMRKTAEVLGVNPGYLYHNIGSLHAYRKDWEKLQAYINELC